MTSHRLARIRNVHRTLAATLLALVFSVTFSGMAASADVLTSRVDTGGSGASGDASVFVTRMQDATLIAMSRSESPAPIATASSDQRQIELIEGMTAGVEFALGEDGVNWCYFCFALR